MLVPCPKCGNRNHISASACQCGCQLLIGKPQPEQQYAETVAASLAEQHPEMFPTKSANLIRIPLPQAALESAREMQNQAMLETLPLGEESESRKLGNGKSNINLKRFFVLASFVIIAGAALLAILGGFTEITRGGKSNEKAPTLPAEASLAPDIRNLAASNPADENSIAGKVVDVASGDTITVADASSQEYKIRLEGIDAPEPEQEFGAEAESNLFNLAFGKTVQVDLQKPGADGFTVGKVLLDGNNVSLEQLKAGLAWHDETTVLEQSDKEFYARSEAAARSASLGLWTRANPLSPWEYRSKVNLKQSEDQEVAADGNGETSKVAPEMETVVRETSVATESQTVFTESAPETAQTKSATPGSATLPPTPKVSTPVPPAYEPKPVSERKPTSGSRSATARCGDGTLSYSTTRGRTCAGHGGVARWLGGSTTTKARKRGENSDSAQGSGECFIIEDGKKIYLERGACGN